METIKDTLVVNDKLSVEYEYINKNGEKYVTRRTNMSKDHDFKEFIKDAHIYANAMSQYINQEYYFYNYTDEYTIYDMWNETKWKHEDIDYDDERNSYGSDESRHIYIPLINDTNIREYIDLDSFNEDVLFPIWYRWINLSRSGYPRSTSYYLHFDIFIFLLYLEHPEYKNDLIRFLKYQPVCTKTTDELFIFNLKQTNKDLLKQLNEANDMISQTKKDCECRLETAISETKTNLTSEYELKLNQANETHAHEIKSLKEKYESEIEELITELNIVKTMQDQLITENESLKQDLKTMTCDRDTYKNKFEVLNDKVIKAKNMLE